MHTNPILINGEPFEVILSNEEIEKRVAELGYKVSEEYQGLHPLFIVVLNGAFMFAASLLKSVRVTCETEFIRISSYASKQSTGKVFEILGLTQQLKGRDVIVVEDIVDTGLSMRFLLETLKAQNPNSIRVATLFFKPDALREDVALDYVGFEIENRFVVGYGLDYDGLGRNYPDLYVYTKQ